MSNQITAQELKSEFDSLALDIIQEVKNYGGDQFDLAHQAADGHEWVIYNTRSLDLVHATYHWDGVLFDEAEDWLEGSGQTFKDWQQHTTALAFAIMLVGIERSMMNVNWEAA